MDFLRQAAAATVLVTLSLAIQCVGMAALIDWGLNHLTHYTQRLGLVRSAAFMVRSTTIMIGLHLFQILMWAAFYRWKCFTSWGSAFYFSTTSYSTVGYGDIVLAQPWKNIGPIEAVTGTMMCGLSVSLLFAIVTRLVDREISLAPALADVKTLISEPREATAGRRTSTAD